MLDTILGNHPARREAPREFTASNAHHNHVQVKQSHCPYTATRNRKARTQNARRANRYLCETDIHPKQNREHRLGELAKIAH